MQSVRLSRCDASRVEERAGFRVSLGALASLDTAVARTIIEHLKLPIFFFLGSRLVYTNRAADSLTSRLQAAHGIDVAVILQDHLHRLEPSDDGGREAVVLLTSPVDEPFAVHVVTVSADGASGPSLGSLVTVRELGIDRESFNRRYGLSTRESQVLELVLRGYSNRDIADSLAVTVGTTKKHLTRIFDKVGVDSRAQLISRLV